MRNANDGPAGMDQSSSGPGGTTPSRGTPQAVSAAQPSEALRVLLSRGVPPEVAQQAIENPQLLQQILVQLQRGSLQGRVPNE